MKNSERKNKAEIGCRKRNGRLNSQQMKLSVFRTGIAENTGLNLSAETVSLGVIAIQNVQCIGGRITMADLYFRCGSKSEADSLVESAREFAEKHEMSIEHVIFD